MISKSEMELEDKNLLINLMERKAIQQLLKEMSCMKKKYIKKFMEIRKWNKLEKICKNKDPSEIWKTISYSFFTPKNSYIKENEINDLIINYENKFATIQPYNFSNKNSPNLIISKDEIKQFVT